MVGKMFSNFAQKKKMFSNGVDYSFWEGESF